MKNVTNTPPGNVAALVAVTGKLPALSSKSLRRISAFLVRGNTIVSESSVSASGTFQFHVVPQLASDPTVFAVLGPKGLDSQSLANHPDLPRVALSARKLEGNSISLDFADLNISDKLIDPWWIWCREYTVSGTLLTAAGCPIGAEVTVYNVTSGVSGLVETPIVTIPTDFNGNFTATFNWCSWRFCWWPCWPIWWRCWPWWWELDMLAVIENLEQRLRTQPAGAESAITANVAPLRQPNAADLMTGVGFAALRPATALQPDSARTALVASKLANPTIREIFPWWWWCCENPNIVFSATQGATVILNEDFNTSTRWCFPSGQTVSLTGNNQSLGACPIQTGGECGFAWTAVGGEPPNAVLVENISMGYAEGPGGACSNLAFAGSLDLNGVFSGDCVAYYQVLAGQWGGSGSLATAGNPARGGTTPVSYPARSETLVNYVTIWRDGIGPQQYKVALGPFSYNGQSNLYVTLSQRQNTGVPLPASVLAVIGAFPALGPKDFVMGWAYPDLVLTVPAGDLVSPALTGGVNLTVAPYDINADPINPMDFDLGPDLTLMIDTTALTTATIDWVHVFNSDGSKATPTTASGSECPAYQITTPDGGYALVHVTVIDDAAHLCEYYIQTQYGSGSTIVPNPSDRDYAQDPVSFAAALTPPPYGVDAGYGLPNDSPAPPPALQVPAVTNWTYVGGGDTIYVPITQSCCYDFQLWVSKRTTDGEDSPCGAWNPAFQTVNIVVSGS